jgi:hypothetical protein
MILLKQKKSRYESNQLCIGVSTYGECLKVSNCEMQRQNKKIEKMYQTEVKRKSLFVTKL